MKILEKMNIWKLALLLTASIYMMGCGDSKKIEGVTPVAKEEVVVETSKKGAWETDESLSKKVEVGEYIVIGVAGPLSGEGKQFGVTMSGGFKLAEEQINKQGGLSYKGGEKKKFKFIFSDDEGNPNKAESAAQILIDNKEIGVVLGHFNSSCSLNAQEKYAKSGMVQMSPASTNPTLCERSRWTFRNIFNDTTQGQYWARHLKNKLKFERVAIISVQNDYGEGLKKAFNDECKVLGLEIVAQRVHGEQTQDYKTIVKGLIEGNPQAIFIADTYGRGAKVIKQARELGVGDDILLCGSDGIVSDALIKNAGKENVEGVLVTLPIDIGSKDPNVVAFVEAYQALNGDNPDAWSAYAYDAFTLAAQVIAEVGYDPKLIREKLQSMDSKEKAFKGVTGETYFDKNGDCLKPFTIGIVKDGKFVGVNSKEE